MPKKITMSDIAAALGISTVTVSKALSGQKGVSEEMRQKIIDLAEERGYQKSFTNRSSDSFKIGVLIGARYLGNIDSFYGHMYQIFSAKAGKIGSFTMLEVLSLEEEENLVYPKLIGDGNVDAVVIMGTLREDYLKMLDDKLETPTFYMDFTDRQHKKDSVISGSFYGAYILTNYLFDKGIDKILKKVGEEATEIVIAAKNPNSNEVVYEMSDFLYHMMVLMAEKNVSWEDITSELARR